MSAITAFPIPRTRIHTGRVTQARVALSEWTKLRTLRSTRYALLAGVAMTIGFAIGWQRFNTAMEILPDS